MKNEQIVFDSAKAKNISQLEDNQGYVDGLNKDNEKLFIETEALGELVKFYILWKINFDRIVFVILKQVGQLQKENQLLREEILNLREKYSKFFELNETVGFFNCIFFIKLFF